MAPNNGLNDAVRIDDKMLRDAEEGHAMQQLVKPVVSTPASGIGNPAPLGLLCFGMTTVMLMFVNTTWTESTFIATVMCYACFYGGFGQMVAGVFELIKGNTFAGTAFFSYGAFWMAFFLGKLLAAQKLAAGAAEFKVAETLFLCLWGVFTTLFFIPTLRKNLCLMTVFGTLAITFFMLAGGVWNHQANMAAGYMGFVCGCSAIYTAFAEIWEENLKINMPGLRPVAFI